MPNCTTFPCIMDVLILYFSCLFVELICVLLLCNMLFLFSVSSSCHLDRFVVVLFVLRRDVFTSSSGNFFISSAASPQHLL